MAHPGEIPRGRRRRSPRLSRGSRPGREQVGPVATIAVVLGLGASVLAPVVLTAAQFITLFLGGALAGGLAGMLPWSLSEVRSLDSRDALLDAAGKAETGAVLSVATGVVVVGLGPYGWAVAIAALAAALLLPLVLGRLAQVPTPRRDAPSPRGATVLCAPPFDRCSTTELVVAWTASRDLLQATSSALMRARLAALRADYLDELERRDHTGVQRWLASGAEASGDLGHFLRGHDDGDPQPDAR